MDTLSQKSQPPIRRKPWIFRPKGWVVLVVATIVAVLAGMFVWQTYTYYRQIQNGTFDYNAFAKEFTVSGTDAVTHDGPVDISVDDDPSLGNPEAPITIVAFEDFECPFCQQSFPIIRELMLKYPDDIYFVYRDFPVASTHPYAESAALAAECADDQGLFWEMHDKLFQNQSDLTDEALFSYARAVGVSQDAFKACFTQGEHTVEITKDIADGLEAGVRGTPTWFVNGEKIEGVLPLVVWQSLIDRLLEDL